MNESASGLIDIIEPAAPMAAAAANWPWLAATLAASLLVIAMLLMLWKKKWPAYRAIKRLRKLQQQIIAGEVSLQHGVILLSQELRVGLKLAQQLPKQAPENFTQQDIQLWTEFVQRLDRLRYQHGEALAVAELAPIISRIETWLWRYCR